MHPYQHSRPEQPQKTTQVYRVICNGTLKPGDMIEAVVVARDCELALKYVKADSRYAASRVLDVTAGSGAEGQVLMARYTPAPCLNIYQVSLVKNVRERSYFDLVVLARNEEEAKALRPVGMSASQAADFGWAEDQVWKCEWWGVALPENTDAKVIYAQQKW